MIEQKTEQNIENFGGGGYAGHSGIIGLTDWSLYPYFSYINNNKPDDNYQNYLDSQKQGDVIIEKYKHKSKKKTTKYILALSAFILFSYMVIKH